MHTVFVVLAVVATLTVVVGVMVVLWHSAHAAPYDSGHEHEAPAGQLPAGHPGSVVTQVVHVHGQGQGQGLAAPDRTAALTAEVAELRAQVPGQLAAPTAQHLHLHGVSADDVAAILARVPNGVREPSADGTVLH